MNIVWKRPNGGIAITVLTPEALAQIEEAKGYAPLLDQEEALLAQQKTLTDEYAVLQSSIDALAAPSEPSDEDRNKIAHAKQAQQDLHTPMQDVSAQLRKIDFYRQVEATHGLTLDAHAAMLQARGDIPADHIMVAQALPLEAFIAADRANWREAWTWTTDAPVIDIDHGKAVEITKNRLRRECEPLLAAQDTAFMRALEQGKDTAAVIAEKQRLRDITTLADQAKTLDELKSITA